MGRLRQYNPNNYGSARAIHDEFENIVRYIVAGERGNLSYAEMFDGIFDEDGKLSINVSFEFDGDGLKMKIGEKDWELLAPVEALRGNPGRDVGLVPLPVITGLVNYEATSGQTVFAYVHGMTDTLFVSHNGVLLTKDVHYTNNATNDTITLLTGATAGDIISVYKVRGDAGIVVTRTDTPVTASSQAVFGVTFPTNQYQEQVYLNGILLAKTSEYVINEATSSITLLDAAVNGDILTVVFIAGSSSTEIPGLMLEGVYTDMQTGLIPYEKIMVGDDEIPSEKVSGLQTFMLQSAKITVGTGTPTTPDSGDFWLDTSTVPATLKIYDASQFVSVQPVNTLPTVRTTDAGYAIFINSTGTGFTYRPIDFTGLIPAAQKAAPGGVATLDSEGKLDASQRSTIRTRDVIDIKLSGAVANGTYVFRRLFGERFRIIGLTAKTTSGSCTIQLGVSGTAAGSTYSAAATANDQNLSSVIEVDSLVLSKTLDLIVTSASSCNDIYVTVVIERLI